jgi:hypothetical protein
MKRRHRIAHGRIWLVLGALLPAILAVALLGRQPRTVEAPVVRLSTPAGAMSR